MKLNPKKLVLTVCLGAVVGLAGLAGCQTSGDRSAGRYEDDKKVASRVKKDLKEEPVYKFTDVHVAAYDGVVQLSGFVNTQDQKNRASDVARHADGVREVVNSLVIKPQVAATGPAPVINNENRITSPTGAPTGRRIDAETSATHYGGNAAGATGTTTGTTSGTSGTTITPSGPPTTSAEPITPSQTKAPSESISSPSVNITTPNVNINTNAPSSQ
ncbi:BON domain-containing protein [Pedosphaera parvula]|uniref:Transport-associated protein n=1 Tax=Pedosphaera parvula (strain Ellin514) TaxID=320771 RepID=B9XIN2_PEDPL|nr:BON domain-containing protein [Pedosphaera parvula]EEF60295.1 transport-associated protein [Pedosphaera parvula Ellin514]